MATTSSGVIPVRRSRHQQSGTLVENARIDIRYPISIGIFAFFALAR